MAMTENAFTMDPTGYAEAFKNVNPLGTGAAQQTFGNLSNVGSSYDPQAFLRAFLGSSPALQGISTSATSDLALQQKQYLQSLLEGTTAGIGNQLANMNAVNSSALPRMIAQEMAPQVAQAATTMSGQRIGLLNTLMGQALPSLQRAYEYAPGLALQALGLQAQMADPTMVAPEVEAQKTGWGSLADWLKIGTDIGSMFIKK